MAKKTVTRAIPFDYAHEIFGTDYHGPCRYCHGHRGVAEITIEALELDSLGMVVDFSVIKKLVGEWVDNNWDHNCLLHKEDPLIMVLQDKQPNRFPYIMKYGNPTAENIARELFEKAEELLPKEMMVMSVRVWETSNCSANYSR